MGQSPTLSLAVLPANPPAPLRSPPKSRHALVASALISESESHSSAISVSPFSRHGPFSASLGTPLVCLDLHLLPPPLPYHIARPWKVLVGGVYAWLATAWAQGLKGLLVVGLLEPEQTGVPLMSKSGATTSNSCASGLPTPLFLVFGSARSPPH